MVNAPTQSLGAAAAPPAMSHSDANDATTHELQGQWYLVISLTLDNYSLPILTARVSLIGI